MKNRLHRPSCPNRIQPIPVLSPKATRCLDFDSLFLLNDPKVSFEDKASLVQHIYKCNSCSVLFSEFLELNDSIQLFCERLHNIRSNRSNFINHFILGLRIPHFKIILPITSVAVLLLLITIITYIGPVFHPSSPSLTRATSSIQWDALYPKPYSTISKRALFFVWSENIRFSHFRITVFDTNLILLFESDFSHNRFVFLNQDLQRLFHSDTFYFWCVKALTDSGNVAESPLFPFKIID